MTLDVPTYRALVRLAYGCSEAEARDVLADTLLEMAVHTAHYDREQGHWLVWVDPWGEAKVQVFP